MKLINPRHNKYNSFNFRLLHDKRQAADAIELLKLLGKKYPPNQQATNTTEGNCSTASTGSTISTPTAAAAATNTDPNKTKNTATCATTNNVDPKISDAGNKTTTAVSAIKAEDAFNQANDTISTNLLYPNAPNTSTCEKTSYTGNNEPKYGLNTESDNQNMQTHMTGIVNEEEMNDESQNNQSSTINKQDRKRRRI